ncbi:MAG: hypothetical protein JRJ66_16125 [Deltaproteobacteria bacterium]|nr:hypothetical protein [Deltaproteobacteria bacterium]
MTEVIQMRNNLARLREHQNEDERKLVIEENGVPLTLDEVFESLAKDEEGDAHLFTKVWYVFNGHCWERDKLNQVLAAVDRVAEVYSKAISKVEEDDRARGSQSDYPLRGGTLKNRIGKLRTLRRRRNVLEFAKAGRDLLGISGDEWDADPWKLGCPNGVIDLRDGSFSEGKPEDYIKTVAPTPWEGMDAPRELFKETLSQIFDGDHKQIDFFQRLMGYAITGLSIEHIFPIIYGRGRNGKDTLFEIFKMVLGDLVAPIQPEMLVKESFVRSAFSHSSDILSLRGKRLVWASETNDGWQLNAGKVKWLTGGGTLTGRAPYAKSGTSFSPTHTVFSLTNNKPQAPASDYALWKRIILIPLNISFVDNPKEEYERQRDPYLVDKLKKEAPGVLAWLVEGALKWQKHGLTVPAKVERGTEEYRRDEDIIGDFLEECCIKENNAAVRASDLYQGYVCYCEKTGHDALSNTRFGTEMKKRISATRSSQGIYYRGLKIKEGLDLN